MRQRGKDISGLAFMVVGLLLAGSVWVQATGSVGAFIDEKITYLVGLVRVVFPVLLVVRGVSIIWGSRVILKFLDDLLLETDGLCAANDDFDRGNARKDTGGVVAKGGRSPSKSSLAKGGRSPSKSSLAKGEEEDLDENNTYVSDDKGSSTGKRRRRIFRGRGCRKKNTGVGNGNADTSGSPRRFISGSFMLLAASTGILHVARGRPGLADHDQIGMAGGFLGVAVGGFLHAYLHVFGAVLLLLFMACVGILLLTQLTAHSAFKGVGLLVMHLGGVLWHSLAGLLTKLFNDLHGIEDEDSDDVSGMTGGDQVASVGSVGDVRTSQIGAVERQGSSFAVDAGGGSSGPITPLIQHVPATPVSERSGSGTSQSGRMSSRSADSSVELQSDSRSEQLQLAAESASQSSEDVESVWRLPTSDILSSTPSRQVDKVKVSERANLLHATLDQFGVSTVLLDPVVGPTVTRFVLELGEGVKVSKLESLRKDIAYAMASPDVRILAPIPGQRAIGVEVPNIDRQVVSLGDVLGSPEARHSAHPLEVAVGRDINGYSIMMNLAATPHLLIAGATGAGKSSCINSIITSVLMRSTPDEVRLILVDPKRVEMGQYQRIPHLLTAPVTDPQKAANALAWAVREMERRYDLLHDTHFRDIAGYNAAVSRGDLSPLPGRQDPDGEPLTYRHMPFVLVIVDELADLMLVAARDVEESIARLAQMARAVGIHLVIATQRPSVNVITGLIKANIPTRIAFAVSSVTDSRVVLDQAGAERLVGQGDMLLVGPSSSSAHRIQGCWVTEREVKAVVAHWVAQAPDFRDDPSVSSGSESGIGVSGRRSGGSSGSSSNSSGSDSTDHDLVNQARELVVQTQLGSTSMLQRKLRVGFARAGRIMDLLEQQGVVGPSTGSKAREVLMTSEDLET